MEFYTNVTCVGNNILYRGVNNNKRVQRRVKYSPSVFLETTEKGSKWKSLDGISLSKTTFNTIGECRDFLKKYNTVENYKIYGNTNFQYAYIAEKFSHNFDWNFKEIKVDIIDIECKMSDGFPNASLATQPITTIAIYRLGGKKVVFGYKDYVKEDDEYFVRCSNEIDLLNKFLGYFSGDCPDIVSGWNVKYFDLPYIINRIIQLLGEETSKLISPWKIHRKSSSNNGMANSEFYYIYGISVLDYLDLYKNFANNGKSQESYKLDFIAEAELGENKVDYSGFKNLDDLYERDYQKYVRYNIHDTVLISKLDDKLKLFELAVTLAYDTKSNYDDVFTQTRMLDALINCRLMEENVVVPPNVVSTKDAPFTGAYVKEPQVGLHEGIASFDLDSLYPHLIMQYNISPECLVPHEDWTQDMKMISNSINIEDLLKKKVDLSRLPENVTVTPNGQFFRIEKQGYLPKLLSNLYSSRKDIKKQMIEEKKKLELIRNEINRRKELKVGL